MQSVDHKCPNCNAVLKYNPKGKNWKCEYCGSAFKKEDIAKNDEKFEKTKVKKQSVEIEDLKKELEHYKSLENTLNHAIMKAEETSDNIKKMAREESDMIITDAKHNASRIVNEALLRAEKIEQNTDMIERNMRIFKRKLKAIIEQQLAVVEEIEVLEIETSICSLLKQKNYIKNYLLL